MWQRKISVVKSEVCSTKAFKCQKLNLTEETHMFYQVGEPRSASTYQYIALCATVMIKYGHKNVACKYLAKSPKKPINVIKSHSVKDLGVKKGRYVLFTSTRSGDMDRFENLGADVHFLLYFQDLLQLGDYVLQYYRDLFDLTDEEYEILHEYMHYWQIMRKCCAGPQSSALFVRELWEEDPKKHHGRTPFLYNDCKYYDLEGVGNMMKNTTFCQMTNESGEICPGPNRCKRSFVAIEEKRVERLERLEKKEREKERIADEKRKDSVRNGVGKFLADWE